MLADNPMCKHMHAYAAKYHHAPASTDSNWLQLDPRIRIPCEILIDSSRDPNCLWLLAAASSRSHQIGKHRAGDF